MAELLADTYSRQDLVSLNFGLRFRDLPGKSIRGLKLTGAISVLAVCTETSYRNDFWSVLGSVNLRAVKFEDIMKARLKTLHATLVLLLYFVFVLNWGFSNAQNGVPEGAASIVFVFDTTGSMYDDLVQVRAGAAKILSTTLERKVRPLYNYVLIPFHDPG